MFNPKFTITPALAGFLLRIEAAKEKAVLLPLNPVVLASLRESARLCTTHYSTMIEGNKLSLEQVGEVVSLRGHFPGRERDIREVRGYYTALAYVEKVAAQGGSLTEAAVQKIHALVMEDGRDRVKASPYRHGQNVIRDGATGAIVYLPPEAKDVAKLMKALIAWAVDQSGQLPVPLIAGVVHYQFATIHPYYDGNGRTARLLTTLVLSLSGYALKGLFSLEEYYARALGAYYEAISIGPSHNYYEGRAESDITEWLEYFCAGTADAFERVTLQMQNAQTRGFVDQSGVLRTLSPQQRLALTLFHEYEAVTSGQIGALFGGGTRGGAALCRKWVASGFLEVANPSNKARTYRLAAKLSVLIEG